MTEDQVNAVATFKAKTGMDEAAEKAIPAPVEPTRSEAGCIDCDLRLSADDPSVLILYENGIGKKYLVEHLAMTCLKSRWVSRSGRWSALRPNDRIGR